MSGDKRSWIGALTPRTRALALVGLILEGLYLASLPALPVEDRGFLLIMAAVILMAIIVGIVILERGTEGQKRSVGDISIRPLRSREDLYRRCAALIAAAQDEVLDTTWGPAPRKRTRAEEEALQGYINARRDAVAHKSGFHYREMFTVPRDDKERTDRVQTASKDASSNAAYEVRVLREFLTHGAMPDFLVIDRKTVVLSHVDTDSPSRESQFLEIECTPLAELFRDWHIECWREAEACDTADATYGQNVTQAASRAV